MCEGILSSASYAVKAAQAPFKQVILINSSGRYKSLRFFMLFGKNKNYDAVEITRYYMMLESHRLATDRLETCE
jgi:hypothetical protein